MIVEKKILLAMDDKKLVAVAFKVWRRNWGAGFGEEMGRFGFFVPCDWVVLICCHFLNVWCYCE